MDQLTNVLHSFGVNGPAFVASLVNFVILLIVLQKFAYKPLLQVLEERKKKIADSMKQSEQIKDELTKTQALREEILAKANAAAQKMIDEARLAAEKFKDQKLNDALLQAQETLKKAQQAGVLEREKIMSDLRKEMVALVIATTTKVTGKILTADDQKRLSEETVRELAAA
jgi:F-type H+-transporting ATPase subunit b